jgi:hypothetical protein
MKKAANLVAGDKSGRNLPRVKLRRINCNSGKIYPPDGDGAHWWASLKQVLSTCSSAFVDASLAQLQAAARMPSGVLSETAINAALALIRAAEPRNEVEAALAVQMACAHTATMAVLARLGGAPGGSRNVGAYARAAATLMRAYALQVETLRRLRNGNSQVVRVEHVHVSDGGQAIIGNVGSRPRSPDPGDAALSARTV